MVHMVSQGFLKTFSLPQLLSLHDQVTEVLSHGSPHTNRRSAKSNQNIWINIKLRKYYTKQKTYETDNDVKLKSSRQKIHYDKHIQESTLTRGAFKRQTNKRRFDRSYIYFEKLALIDPKRRRKWLMFCLACLYLLFFFFIHYMIANTIIRKYELKALIMYVIFCIALC